MRQCDGIAYDTAGPLLFDLKQSMLRHLLLQLH
jgi:hypothetical protein